MYVGDTYIGRGQAADIATLTGTHIKTVQTWFRKRRFPKPVELLLRLVYGGDLGLISHDWDGFTLQPKYGVLVTDQGYSFGPGEVRAWQIRCHQIAHLTRRVRELEQALAATISDAGDDGLSSSPSPPARLARTGSPS